MVPFTAPSFFDEDILFILHEFLEIDTTEQPLHEIPEGLINNGVDQWEDFMCQDPYNIPSYPIRGNNRTSLSITSAAIIQIFLQLVTKSQNNNDPDFDNAKSYTMDMFETHYQYSMKARCRASAATLPPPPSPSAMALAATATSSPFDADMLFIVQDVLEIDMTAKPLHEIPEALIAEGAVKWDDFLLCCDPYDIPSWTYPIHGNIRSYLNNVSVAKLQFLLNYIEKRRNDNDDDIDDAKSYKQDEFQVYYRYT